MDENAWSLESPPPRAYPRLCGKHTCDVLIVGAGYTGLSTAYHLAQQKIDCAVIEAKEPGHGASGRNAGHVMAFTPATSPTKIMGHLGHDKGTRYLDVVKQAADHLFAFIREHEINCGARQDGHLGLIRQAATYQAFTSLIKQWNDVGVAGNLIPETEIKSYINCNTAAGGFLMPAGGMINPLAYVRGLAEVVRKTGTRLYAQSPAISIMRRDDKWIVKTPDGEMVAQRLVLTINAYAQGLWPGLARSMYAIKSGVLASAPNLANPMFSWKGPWAWVDDKTLCSGLTTDQGRFMMSVLPTLQEGKLKHVAKAANKRLQRRFPGIAPVDWKHYWSGNFSLIPDRFPRVVSLDENAYALFGYSGGGIALSAILGREFSRFLANGSEDSLPLPLEKLKTVPFSRTFPFLCRSILFPLARWSAG